MNDDLRAAPRDFSAQLDSVNALLLDPHTRVVNDLIEIVGKFGTPEEINVQARAAQQLAISPRPPSRTGFTLSQRYRMADCAARHRGIRLDGGIPPSGTRSARRST